MFEIPRFLEMRIQPVAFKVYINSSLYEHIVQVEVDRIFSA